MKLKKTLFVSLALYAKFLPWRHKQNNEKVLREPPKQAWKAIFISWQIDLLNGREPGPQK